MRIAGFNKFSLSDFPGKVAAVVFTHGCNYNCPYCHNRQILNVGDEAVDNADSILEFLSKRRGFIDGLVITGGEPCIQQGLVDFCRKAKAMDVALKLDTNGSRPDVFEMLLDEGLLDYLAMDIKAPFQKYDAVCGKAVDKQAVLRSMERLLRSSTPMEFRTTAVPTLLDEDDILEIGEVIHGRAKHYLQKYKPVGGAERPSMCSLNIQSVQAELYERFGQTHVR